jgi:DNA transposition AAA+ family ATPase
MTTTLETDVKRGTSPAEAVTKSDIAEAASAHARINIPLNLENWRGLPEETTKELLWFHQHLLDANMGLKEAGAAIDYDESTVFRVLKGIYEGSWGNVVKGIQSYRRLAEARANIQQAEFVENAWTRLIFGALGYALANNSVALVTGESRQGKTMSGLEWKRRNNHGRAVFVTVPPYGGPKALLRRIAAAVGINKNLSAPQMTEAIYRAFNAHRILIVDEAHRLLPGDRRTNPVMLEILRDIKDETGCALAFLATERFNTELRKGEYMFEQVLGRIGMPTRLPRKASDAEIEPIVKQYVSRPSKAVMETCLDIANKPGRLGILVETLKVASRIAKKAGERLGEEHVFKAVQVREQMQGEAVFAK